MKYNYDTVAAWYDRLQRLVFGDALVNAQLYLLQAIPQGAHILIAGGGTGAILEEITRLHPGGLTITFADTSEKMTALARNRNTGDNKVTFFAAPVETVLVNEQYDVVLTPFLFDNFTDEVMKHTFSMMDQHLTKGGIWLYCDFVNSKLMWQRLLLKSMYLFFRLMSGVKASHLPDAEGCFKQHNYTVTARQYFYKGFVTAVVFKKEGAPTGNPDMV